MIEVRPLGAEQGLTGVLELVPKRFGDDRGFFSETYHRARFREAGLEVDFIQDNHSFSAAKGVLRGLHYQLPPHAQDKLVRVVRGAVLDVAVDIRRSSPTFGKWVALELTPEKWNQIFVPKGFAHGFLTLAPDTEVIYKVSDVYSPAHDRGIRFDDPAIGIDWPLAPHALQLSDKDRNAPALAQAEVFD